MQHCFNAHPLCLCVFCRSLWETVTSCWMPTTKPAICLLENTAQRAWDRLDLTPKTQSLWTVWPCQWGRGWRLGWVNTTLTPSCTMSSLFTTLPRLAWGTCCESNSTTLHCGEAVKNGVLWFWGNCCPQSSDDTTRHSLCTVRLFNSLIWVEDENEYMWDSMKKISWTFCTTCSIMYHVCVSCIVSHVTYGNIHCMCCMKHKWPFGSTGLSVSDCNDITKWFGSSLGRFDMNLYTESKN